MKPADIVSVNWLVSWLVGWLLVFNCISYFMGYFIPSPVYSYILDIGFVNELLKR